MSTRSSVLQVNRPKKTMGFRVDRDLEHALDGLRDRIKREAPEMSFRKAEIVEEALRNGIAMAHKALDARLAAKEKGGSHE